MKQPLVTPALLLFALVLLLALTLGLTGCSQDDNAPVSATQLARGGEPISISVAPKPGFADINNPGTRNTVADDGTFSWQSTVLGVSESDNICVHIAFNDAAATQLFHSWAHEAGSHFYMTDWFPMAEWPTGTDASDIVWPVGASKVTVRAFYTDCKYTGSHSTSPTSQSFDYSQGTGDHMIFQKAFALGEPIVVNFSHSTTRLVFKGLTPATAYSLNVAGTPMTFPTVLTVADFSLGSPAAQTFTSDANGKLAICADLDSKINAATGKLSLELMTVGVSAGTTELTAKGAAGAYVMNGYQYTVNVAGGSGPVNPDSHPDLLPPAPIVPGNTVYEVNGYYVTAPGSDEINDRYSWATFETADPCTTGAAAGKGWKTPSMKDFEAMLGWSQTNPWTDSSSTDTNRTYTMTTDAATAFLISGAGDHFLSSDAVTGDMDSYWSLLVTSPDNAGYAKSKKTIDTDLMRCVKKQ